MILNGLILVKSYLNVKMSQNNIFQCKNHILAFVDKINPTPEQ